MASESKIEWTDATWNPLRGCLPYSAGCLNCYAAATNHRFGQPGMYAHGLTVLTNNRPTFSGVVKPVWEKLREPLRWKRPRRIFVNSMSDLFYGDEADRKRCAAMGVEFQPVPFGFIDAVFGVMALAPQHTFQLLTKRPGRMREYFAGLQAAADAHAQATVAKTFTPTQVLNLRAFAVNGPDGAPGGMFGKVFGAVPWPLPNVWIGTSVENQAAADERIPHLLQCPAAVRFLSCEPLLGPVNLTRLNLGEPECSQCGTIPMVDCTHIPNIGCECCVEAKESLAWHRLGWVIAGGESGPGARPCNVEWVRSILNQCQAAGVPCFIKQLGAKIYATGELDPLDQFPDPVSFAGIDRNTIRVTLRDRKGGDWTEWPADLLVREFPA